jgi:hypothetical protein
VAIENKAIENQKKDSKQSAKNSAAYLWSFTGKLRGSGYKIGMLSRCSLSYAGYCFLAEGIGDHRDGRRLAFPKEAPQQNRLATCGTTSHVNIGLSVIYVPRVPFWKMRDFNVLDLVYCGNPLISREI